MCYMSHLLATFQPAKPLVLVDTAMCLGKLFLQVWQESIGSIYKNDQYIDVVDPVVSWLKRHIKTCRRIYICIRILWWYGAIYYILTMIPVIFTIQIFFPILCVVDVVHSFV